MAREIKYPYLVGVNLDEETHTKLTRDSDDTERSISQMVRWIVKKYYKENK